MVTSRNLGGDCTPELAKGSRALRKPRAKAQLEHTPTHHCKLAKHATSTYIVVSGDTGNAIAAKHSTSFSSLMDANPDIIDWSSLHIGCTIQIPSLRTPVTYKVTPGDTGNSISAVCNIYLSDLSAANPTVNWKALQIGQTLEVPAYGIATTYAVVNGDTGSKIATDFGITFASLLAVNPNVKWSNLHIGQVLQIPAGVSPNQGRLPFHVHHRF